MIIKVCGMRASENIREVEALGIDWMGFIFYTRSSRYVGANPPAYLPCHCKRVGVFVNSPASEILHKVDAFGLDIVQLHGDESPAFCCQLRESLADNVQLIKMVSISCETDLTATTGYAPYIDYFLFESPCGSYGGSGKKFDWSLLEQYHGNPPFILTGGIGSDDAEEIHSLTHPRFAGIDLNSRFEVSAGTKNPELLRTFIDKIRTT